MGDFKCCGWGNFFHEFEQCFQGFTAFMFVVGLLTIFLGVFLLSPQPKNVIFIEEDPPIGSIIGESARSPLLPRDSFFSSGGGMGMSLPTPTLVQAVSVRNMLSPFSSDSTDLQTAEDRTLTRTSSTLNFGFASFPVVDAVEARDQRTNSGVLVADQLLSRSRSGSGRTLTM